MPPARNKRITVHATDDEHALIRAAAGIEGIPMQDLMLAAGMGAAIYIIAQRDGIEITERYLKVRHPLPPHRSNRQ